MKAIKSKTFTQEQIREQISEYLKDCPEDKFMTVTQVCFKEFCPEFEKERDKRGFRLISMLD